MKALNSSGRILELTREEYDNLQANGLKLTLVEEDDDKKKSDKIGVYLQRFFSKEKYCASDRIRGEWIIKNSDKFELYREGVEYDTVIFHRPVEEIAKTRGIKILDLCDAVWKHQPDFLTLIEPVDAVIVSTQGLKEELRKITNKKIFVIDDGHDLDYYKTRRVNYHDTKAKEAVWFGYAQNAHCIVPYIRTLRENGIKLKVISQCPLPPLDRADKFVKWDVDTCIEEISKSDFALLPKNGKLKSNNKEITAYLSGIPVARNEEDIKRLVNPKERKQEMERALKTVYEYDAKNIAERYLDVVYKIKHDYSAYTAICGGFDNKRHDITAFSDRPSDKFLDPLMNAKVYKVLSHKFFDNKYTVWVDGNVSLKTDAGKLIELLGDADMALFKHPYRDCLYKEYEHARERVSKDQYESIDEQVKKYRDEGMPEKFGLAECGMIIRKEGPIVEEFNNRWWAEICRYSHRDQMSFPYVWWKMKDRIKINLMDGNIRNHKYFSYENHKRSE